MAKKAKQPTRLSRALQTAKEQQAARVEFERDRREARLKRDNQDLNRLNEALAAEIEVLRAQTDVFLSLPSDNDGATFARKRLNQKGDSSTAILALSDWHVGETVHPNDVNGANEYNDKIAQARAERTFTGFLELLERLRGFATIRDVVVWLGGDIITGYLHEDQRRTNSLAPVEEIDFAMDLIKTGANTILAEKSIRSVRFITNHGNHGRLNPKKILNRSHRDSLEWLMYTRLSKDVLPASSRVSWTIGEGVHVYAQVEGHKVRFHHGDYVKFHGAIGGITTTVEKSRRSWNEWDTPAFDLFGHFHQFVPMRRWVCNGSLIGYNSYALAEVKAGYEPPTQGLVVVSKKYGKVMALPILCDRGATEQPAIQTLAA